MKTILNSRFIILNSIRGAFISLKSLCDPAVEGNPYLVDLPKKIEEVKTTSFKTFGRKKYAFRRYA